MILNLFLTGPFSCFKEKDKEWTNDAVMMKDRETMEENSGKFLKKIWKVMETPKQVQKKLEISFLYHLD